MNGRRMRGGIGAALLVGGTVVGGGVLGGAGCLPDGSGEAGARSLPACQSLYMALNRDIRRKLTAGVSAENVVRLMIRQNTGARNPLEPTEPGYVQSFDPGLEHHIPAGSAVACQVMLVPVAPNEVELRQAPTIDHQGGNERTTRLGPG